LIGNLQLKQGKVDAALEQFSEAIRLDSLCAACHHNRAIALYRKRRTSDACKDLLRSAALGQKVPEEMRRKMCGTN
ncbi:MAG: tetratricopeptide repeat protein, partial [Bacteroidota bacterium]